MLCVGVLFNHNVSYLDEIQTLIFIPLKIKNCSIHFPLLLRVGGWVLWGNGKKEQRDEATGKLYGSVVLDPLTFTANGHNCSVKPARWVKLVPQGARTCVWAWMCVWDIERAVSLISVWDQAEIALHTVLLILAVCSCMCRQMWPQIQTLSSVVPNICWWRPWFDHPVRVRACVCVSVWVKIVPLWYKMPVFFHFCFSFPLSL